MVYYLGAAEVDQRQHFILQADKLREVLGASQLISETSKVAKDVVKGFPGVEIAASVSGAIKLTASDLTELAGCLRSEEHTSELHHTDISRMPSSA